MQDLNKLPSVSNSQRTNGHKSSAHGDNTNMYIGTREASSPDPVAAYENGGADAFAYDTTPDDNTEPEFLTALDSPTPVSTAHTIPKRGRSLQMQYRFWRTLFFAARLFISILWWQFV